MWLDDEQQRLVEELKMEILAEKRKQREQSFEMADRVSKTNQNKRQKKKCPKQRQRRKDGDNTTVDILQRRSYQGGGKLDETGFCSYHHHVTIDYLNVVLISSSCNFYFLSISNICFIF